jgi:hypothetical protein
MVPPEGFPFRMVKVKSAFTAENDDTTLANYKALLHDHGKDVNWQTNLRERSSRLRVHDYHFRPEAYTKGRLNKSASKYIRPKEEVNVFLFFCPLHFFFNFF